MTGSTSHLGAGSALMADRGRRYSDEPAIETNAQNYSYPLFSAMLRV
jgi:hypothetical protein